MRISDEKLAECRANETVDQRILHAFGYFGHYMFVKRGGLGGKQHVLKTLLGSGGEMTQRELLEEMSISSASLSEVLGKLERAGLIRRERSEADKRQLEIVLTETGTGLACTMVENEREFEANALSILSDDEKRDLLATLDRIFDYWREHEKLDKEACPCSKN